MSMAPDEFERKWARLFCEAPAGVFVLASSAFIHLKRLCSLRFGVLGSTWALLPYGLIIPQSSGMSIMPRINRVSGYKRVSTVLRGGLKENASYEAQVPDFARMFRKITLGGTSR